MRNLILACLVSLFAGAVAGYSWCKSRADKETAAAVAKANEENLKRTNEVIHGWAAAVGVLRDRIRAGYSPRIPVSQPAPAPGPSRGPDGGTSDHVSHAGELGTCKAERQRLIEDCALTTIQLRGLQTWAK